MSQSVHRSEPDQPVANTTKQVCKQALRRLQVELVKLQRHSIASDDKILIILKGRDAADKDGTIKPIVQQMSRREPRVVALGKPTSRDRKTWCCQR